MWLFQAIKVIYKFFLLNLVRHFRFIIRKFEKYLPLITILALLFGFLLGKLNPSISAKVGTLIDLFINSYNYIAPMVILLILAPVVARMMRSNRIRKFGKYILFWTTLRRFFACLWAVIFTMLVFDLPLLPNNSNNFSEALVSTFGSFIKMMISNPYFYAVVLSIILGLISKKNQWLYNLLNNYIRAIEYIGQHSVLLIPLFMITIGVYIYELPNVLEKQIELNGRDMFYVPIRILGTNIDMSSPWGILLVYILGTLLVGVSCFIWHSVLILWTKRLVKGFSIKEYFSRYWIRVYPLLWATSSESLATPLNLSLVKKYYPDINRDIRRFVIGTGSYLNINGTLICVYVLTGLVGTILGCKPSLLSLILSIPMVFLIAYGVPGLPGELILFAGPIAVLINIPETVLPMFLVLYSGLQLGLPDSFRTGNNSTDDCVFSILLDDIYKRKFTMDEK